MASKWCHIPQGVKKTDLTGFSYITQKVAWSIVKIKKGAWLFLCLFVHKGYVECRKAQLIQVWPIYGVKMTSHAPKVLKNTDFTGFSYFSHIDSKKVVHIREIPPGPGCPLYFFVLKGIFNVGKHNGTNSDQYMVSQWRHRGQIS